MSDLAGRQTMDVDIVCVGFGPAMGGFLTTLARELVDPDGTPRVSLAVKERYADRWTPLEGFVIR